MQLLMMVLFTMILRASASSDAIGSWEIKRITELQKNDSEAVADAQDSCLRWEQMNCKSADADDVRKQQKGKKEVIKNI